MSLDSIIIREIQPQDNVEIEAIIRAAFIEFDMSLVNSTFEDEEMSDLHNAFQGNDRVYYVIKSKEGRVLGGSGIYPLKGHDATVCELQKMYLSPEIRGKGYGKLLLKKCIQAAKYLGYQQCYLESAPQLKSAINLYNKHGFVNIDKAMGNIGHSFCSIWMVKDL